MSRTGRRQNKNVRKAQEPPEHVWKDEEQEAAGPAGPEKMFFPLTIKQSGAAAEYEGDINEELRMLLQSVERILKDRDCPDLERMVKSGLPVYIYMLGSKETLFHFYTQGKQITDYVVLYLKEAENGPFYVLVSEPGARKVERIVERLSGKGNAAAVLKTQPDQNLRAATNEELFFERLVMEKMDQPDDPELFDGRTRHTFQGWRFIGKGFGQKVSARQEKTGKKPVSYI